ncbi:MAG TPA: nitroreductase [Allosphingosinicella sp.]|nr:nitroreductase [Allosphingosinicella sp.]
MTEDDSLRPLAAALEHLTAARHSCRAFLPDPVPHGTIERIVRLAGRAASWCNAQPWQLIITEGAATERFRAALMAQAPADPHFPWPTAYHGPFGERRRACGYQLYEAVGIARDDAPARAAQAMENFRLFGAPHVALLTSDSDLGTYGAIDCGGFIANFLLAAHSLGVASIAQAALSLHSDFIARHFALPAGRRFICGISFGYEDASHPANAFRTARAPLDEVAVFVEA